MGRGRRGAGGRNVPATVIVPGPPPTHTAPGAPRGTREEATIFRKTKMCKFNILAVCRRGSNCAFAHSVEELEAPPDLSFTKICKTLINTGFCEDPNCTYAHSKEELRNASDLPSGFREATDSGSRRLQQRETRPIGNASAVSIGSSGSGNRAVSASQGYRSGGSAHAVTPNSGHAHQPAVFFVPGHLIPMRMIIPAYAKMAKVSLQAQSCSTASTSSTLRSRSGESEFKMELAPSPGAAPVHVAIEIDDDIPSDSSSLTPPQEDLPEGTCDAFSWPSKPEDPHGTTTFDMQPMAHQGLGVFDTTAKTFCEVPYSEVVDVSDTNTRASCEVAIPEEDSDSDLDSIEFARVRAMSEFPAVPALIHAGQTSGEGSRGPEHREGLKIITKNTFIQLEMARPIADTLHRSASCPPSF